MVLLRSALLVLVSLSSVACTTPDESSVTEGALGGAAVVLAYKGNVALGTHPRWGYESRSSFILRVEADGTTVTAIGETPGADDLPSAVPYGQAVKGRVLASEGQTRMIQIGEGSIEGQVGADGRIDGVFRWTNGTSKPVVLTPLRKMEHVSTRRDSTDCEASLEMVFGAAHDVQATVEGTVERLVTDHCRNGRLLMTEVMAATPALVSVALIEVRHWHAVGGNLIDRRTVGADGRAFDPADSLVGSTESYEKLVKIFGDQNAFVFTNSGHGGTTNDGAADARAWAREHIKLVGNRIVMPVTVSERAFHFRSGVELSISFERVKDLIDPASPLGRYLATR